MGIMQVGGKMKQEEEWCSDKGKGGGKQRQGVIQVGLGGCRVDREV